MKQKQSKAHEPRTALDAAAELIRFYVERGDDLSSFLRGFAGTYTHSWAAQVGGYFWNGPNAHKGKPFGNDKIIVHRVDGKDCAEIFSVKEVVAHIKSQAK